jgi:D-alanyl-D-alanine carboxypeptidase/D-alanyl-D-alanine-endopeptidase (penicillin-binding protein 4)
MNQRIATLLCLPMLGVPWRAAAGGLAEKLDEMVASSPVAQTAMVGIAVADLSTGETLYELNSGRNFVPASNTKLFTTALALVRLGPAYRFVTTVTAPAAPDAAGRIPGPLVLIGSGDPNLSGRRFPYAPDNPRGNPLAAIEELADQVVAAGVRRVDGDIVGDDTAFPWDPYPPGWAIEDPNGESGAPVSALAVGDNTVLFTLRPGTDPARLSVDPPIPYFHFDNRVHEGRVSRIQIDRDPGSLEIRLRGTIAERSQGESFRIAVEDPAHYAAAALRDALIRRGVTVRGEASARHLMYGQGVKPASSAGAELARRTSLPLIEDLKLTSKVSQNLHAEMLLRTVGRLRRNSGTREAGLVEMRAFLAAAGIEPAEYHFLDGSGLSRLNLATPAAIVKLLRFMDRPETREAWLDLLPIGGEDGSLRRRFTKSSGGQAPVSGRIRAKTGTLRLTTALSGYAEAVSGARLAFSIVVNNPNAPASEVRAFVDKLAVALTE